MFPMIDLDKIQKKIENTPELRRKLTDYRGGCNCSIIHVCDACLDPIRLEEALGLGWHSMLVDQVEDEVEEVKEPEVDIMDITRRMMRGS